VDAVDLDVAEGSLQTVGAMLQRIRQLIVQARSDLNSSTNLKSIQGEIDQLKHEIDKVTGDASFNGVKLLDGSLDNSGKRNASVQ